MANNTEDVEQFYLIEIDHYAVGGSINLGQYKSEHKCACGEVFVLDGHSDVYERATVAGWTAKHRAALIQQEANRQKVEMLDKVKAGISPLIDFPSRLSLHADDPYQMFYDRGQNDAVKRALATIEAEHKQLEKEVSDAVEQETA